LFAEYALGALLFVALGDVLALVSIPLLLNRPRFFRENYRFLTTALAVGALAALLRIVQRV